VPGRTRSRVVHFRSKITESPLDVRMLQIAKNSLDSHMPAWRETEWPAAESKGAPATFLHSILRAIELNTPVFETGYVYNEIGYHLRIETEQAGDIRCLNGIIRCTTKSSRPVQFRLWMDGKSSSPLPNRIELLPRSFLRLTLHRIPVRSEALNKETI
jgi:hypothetical protein